ncbi:hypothetical protein ES708_27853 [subsurface metagenome]
MVIIVLPSAGYFFLRSSKTQTWLANIIAKEISENLNARFTLESVNLLFSKRAIFKNLLIEDQHGDTLLFAPELVIEIKSFKRKARKVVINKLCINNSILNFTTDSNNIINLKFIFKPENRKSEKLIPLSSGL